MVMARHRRRASHGGHGGGGDYDAPFDRSSFSAYWSLDEAAGNNRVDAVGSNDLAEASGNVAAAAAKENNGAQFAAATADYLTVADHTDISPTTGVVISFWLVVGGTLPNLTTYPIYKDAGAVNEFNFQMTSAGLLTFTVDQSDGTAKVATANGVLSTSTTYHIVGIAAAGKVSLYIDNVEQTSTAAYDNTIRNGGANLNVAQHFVASLTNPPTVDEIGFWKNPSLPTEAERDDMVGQLYNSGTGLFYDP